MKQTFKKHERLHGKKNIDSFFLQGSSFFLHPFIIHHQTVSANGISPICTILLSVSKRKIPYSTHRNLVKRRMREVFRKNKPLFYDKIKPLKTNSLNLAFIYISNVIHKYALIEKKMLESLERI